jgi:thymidylate synthase
MQNYLSLLNDILKHGVESKDRTGVGTISIFATQLRFDLTRGFPAVTTKKLLFNAMKSELLWFIEGSNDERRLAEILHGTRDLAKTTIWTANANADYWKPKAEFEGDLGRVYGVQWRDWQSPSKEQQRGFVRHDQLKSLIENIKKDPYSRRHILMSYNPGELDKMALPPCHMMCQFYVRDGKLSCQMYQRSVDTFLGLPFNIASYALLTHMIAQVCDLEAHELIMTLGDTHIYSDHIDAIRTQMKRMPKKLPTLWLNPDIKDIEKFTMDDIRLENYEHHPAITAKMAV